MRAEDLGTRVTEAIKASGKPRAKIIAETGISKSELSRIENGHAVNVGRERLALLAKVLGTTAGFLHGDPMLLSPGDREELLRHRDWIDKKLPKLDARDEPNAILIVSGLTRVSSRQRGDLVADTPQVPKLDVPSTFRKREVQHVLRALGDSMIDAGIANNDTLYATAASEPTVGKIIACRWHGDTFVKRVVSEHHRFFLRSENGRYLSIEFDPQSSDFEMIGIVIGRLGAVE
ncbi:MAG: polymerase [Gemmatimonadaceae bacterium]|jgi:transcriptional regulator with XRE-family HTH domain|nr:polymerase [Gemmatimonadaceae bacterium]